MNSNRSLMLFTLAIICLAYIGSCRDDPSKWPSPGPSSLRSLSDQNQTQFDQILDHFNYQSTSYWKQRYWVINKYFKPNAGPVYLFICGQYTCQGVPQQRQWIINLAQRTMGLILVLEHRFYGKSLPFGNDSFKINNLKLLTSQQALSDLAYFIQSVNQQNLYGVNNNPWIAVGGSYPGAMSAWFRYKYPHLTIGAIASSAVVQSIENFQMFDEQMYLSANKSGDWCWQAINASNVRVEQILNSAQNQTFKAQFNGGQNLKDDEFLFYWIDSIVDKIQYGSRTKLCNDLKGKSADDQFNYFIQLAKANNPAQYGSFYLKNETNLDIGNARAWIYQSCTEFGYWQTQSATHALRSAKVNIDFYKRLCAESYGEGTWPKVDRKNTETGGWNLKAFNLMMCNGDEDPWKWSSVLKPQGNIIARVANCNDCAHCVDLYTPVASDAPELKKIREEQQLTIQEWIQAYWRNQKSSRFEKLLDKTLATE